MEDNMKVITFPKNEWDDIKNRFEEGKIVYTIRVSNEYGKFKVGDTVKTEWNLEVKIISVKKIKGGIDELKNVYEFFAELTKDMIQELRDYDEMEIITLEVAVRNIMGNNMDIITFFKNLKMSDWEVHVTKKWQVKDVLSHLIGWEREVAQELLKVFETGHEPWFMLTDSYNDFNDRIYREFKNYSPEMLKSELEKWQNVLEKEIQVIGEEKIKQQPGMDWVFDEGDEPHFRHHLEQVQKALQKR